MFDPDGVEIGDGPVQLQRSQLFALERDLKIVGPILAQTAWLYPGVHLHVVNGRRVHGAPALGPDKRLPDRDARHTGGLVRVNIGSKIQQSLF